MFTHESKSTRGFKLQVSFLKQGTFQGHRHSRTL